jgi:hypothetical protein
MAKDDARGPRTGPEIRKASLLLSTLVLTPDSALEVFRERRVANPALELDHLRHARDILDRIHEAIAHNDREQWSRMEEAWRLLSAAPRRQSSVPSPPPLVTSAPASPAMPTPSPLPSPPLASAPSAPPPRIWSPPSNDRSSEEVTSVAFEPTGPETPFESPPSTRPGVDQESEDPNESTSLALPRAHLPATPFRAVAPAVPFKRPGGPAVRATPFDHPAPNPSSPIEPASDAASFDARITQDLSDGESEDRLTLTADGSDLAGDPALPFHGEEPDEADMTQPSMKAVRPVPASAGANSNAPLPPHLAGLTLEQYASLCAESNLYQAFMPQVHARYGIQSDDQRRALDEHWRARLAVDAELAGEWAKLCRRYEEWAKNRS